MSSAAPGVWIPTRLLSKLTDLRNAPRCIHNSNAKCVMNTKADEATSDIQIYASLDGRCLAAEVAHGLEKANSDTIANANLLFLQSIYGYIVEEGHTYIQLVLML